MAIAWPSCELELTLRLRLGLAATLLAAVLATVGVLLVRTVESSEIAQTDRQLAATLPVAIGLARGPNAFTRPAHAKTPPLPSRSNGLSDYYLAVLDGKRRHVISAPRSDSHLAPATPTVLSGVHRGGIVATTVSSVGGSTSWRALLLNSPGSSRRVLLAVSLATVVATTNTLRLAVILGGLGVAAVLAAAGLWVARLGLRPIAEVTAVADAIVNGDRSRRVASSDSRTEAAHLARVFNVMLDNQAVLEGQLRQFVADASHELRTPTSVVSGLAQLWRQGDLREGEQLDQAMRRIGQAAERMHRLVEELLLLARLDEGSPMERAQVDVAALTREVVTDVAALHPSRTIELDTNATILTVGDKEALRRMIGNLVRNALAHTPANSPVAVKLSAADGGALLEVRDGGPGMTRTEATHAFDRFWRAERSRVRNGSGLGLPIVAGIAEAHGGSVTLDSDPEGGTTVTVALPRKASV
ncbi:MAG TPA: HAMP domain-containing sensor histidine kinase [Solirubrobacteraceae bacterium]|nr:HAMP domain-containing sensor histidine kinase [Solirubrobacteraceae bacterium]